MPARPDARPFIVGANHRSAEAALREKLFVEETALATVLESAKAAGLDQAILISTCDRVELIGAAEDPEAAAQTAQRILAERAGKAADVGRGLYRLYDGDAVAHLFRIACALDSQMTGEAQVLGQVKTAVQAAESAGTLGPALGRLTQTTFQLAKRVRSSTRIGEGAVSVAAAAVRVAEDLFGDLTRRRGLMIGLGETGELMAEQFERTGMAALDLTGPARRTKREAARRGRTYVPFEPLAESLATADVVICAAGQGRYMIDRPTAEVALKARRHRPILVLDCGVPRDVDPAVDGLDDLFLYSLADVERLAEKGQLDRKAEAREAAAMVDAAVAEWRRAEAEREGVPGLVALRRHFEQTRTDVLNRHPNADAEEATRLLINRLLHGPSEALRHIAAEGEAADLKDTITVNRVLRRLFGVDADDAKDDET